MKQKFFIIFINVKGECLVFNIENLISDFSTFNINLKQNIITLHQTDLKSEVQILHPEA